MKLIEKEIGRLSTTMIVRGSLMTCLGVSAAIWPEQILIAAMLAVGAVATVFGLYEITIAVAIRRRASRWRLVLAHGTASVGFGLVTVGAPGVSLRVGLFVVAGWFVGYALLAVRAAQFVVASPAIRRALVLWAVVDTTLALVAVFYPAATIFALLFLGAVYAALFGVWQIAAGIWLHRAVRHPSSSGLETQIATLS